MTPNFAFGPISDRLASPNPPFGAPNPGPSASGKSRPTHSDPWRTSANGQSNPAKPRTSQPLGSLHDSMLVAAALISGAKIVYSEDLQHGQVIDHQLRVTDPF
jgi:hypothetical protein